MTQRQSAKSVLVPFTLSAIAQNDRNDETRASVFCSRAPANDDDEVLARILRNDDLHQLIMQRHIGNEWGGDPPHILAALNARIAALS